MKIFMDVLTMVGTSGINSKFKEIEKNLRKSQF